MDLLLLLLHFWKSNLPRKRNCDLLPWDEVILARVGPILPSGFQAFPGSVGG